MLSGISLATKGVPDADLFNQKLEGTAWRSKPSWYIVGKNDRTVHPNMERFVAKRMGATTTEIASSHVPMLSHPDLVINVIRAAVKAAQESMAEAETASGIISLTIVVQQPRTPSIAPLRWVGCKPLPGHKAFVVAVAC